MSGQHFLTPLQIAEARRLWAAGQPENVVAAAINCGISTFRRHRSPGRQLADLPARPHTARCSGRRSEELEVRLLWNRCAEIRVGWSASEREERSKGLLPGGRPSAEPTPPAGPFPAGHRLKIVPTPGRS